MSGPDIHVETANDHERFERGTTRAGSGCPAAVDGGFRRRDSPSGGSRSPRCRTVTPVVDQRILVHDPSGTAFESLLQLAVFHEGWTAAHGAGEGDE